MTCGELLTLFPSPRKKLPILTLLFGVGVGAAMMVDARKMI